MKTLIVLLLTLTGCASVSDYKKTVNNLDINRFMGQWYVVSGRFTFLETAVHNGIETYTWNDKEERIDINFSFNKGGFNGPLKSYDQKGWIHNKTTNSHWKVSPFWPLKLDYLVLDIAEDYSWVSVGVPNQKYLWIMARDPKNAKEISALALKRLAESGYNVEDIVDVPHK